MLEGDGHDDMELRELQDWIIRRACRRSTASRRSSRSAGLVKQYQIEVDPLALEKYGLTIADVAQAVETNNRNAGGALVSSGQQAMVVRGVGLIQSVADVENIALKAKNGVPVLVQRHRPRVDWRRAAEPASSA